nr:hypothetical protein [Tanacetum cinerariifolium]
MGNVKKSVAKRTHHRRQYDIKVNKRQMQTHACKVDSSKALDTDLVVMESNMTEFGKQDTSSSSENYLTHVVDADIRPVHNQMPFVEIDSNTTPDSTNMSHKGGEIDQDAEQYQTYKELYDSIKKTRIQTKDHNDSLIAQVNSKTVEKADLKAQIQEKIFANAALKNELRKLKGNNVNTNFAKPSILGKPVLQPLRNQSVVRQPIAFRSERPKFSKKGSSRNSSKESYWSNDMAHKYYLKNCIFNANHDDCITKFLKEVNSRAKVQSPKFRNNIYLAKRIPNVNKPERRFSKGYMFSLNKSSVVHEKPNTPRSCLRCKLTGRIFKIAGLRWIPTGKMFIDSTANVDIEPPNGSNDDNTNPYECDQTFNVSAVFRLYTSSLPNMACKKSLNLLEKGLLVWGEAKTTSKGVYRDRLQIADMDRMTFSFSV